MDRANGKLVSQVALITGGTSGIGKSTALLFSREGAFVMITGRRAELGKSVVAEIKANGGQAAYIEVDHTRPEECVRVVESVIQEHGRVDVLFNNAGIVTKGAAEETTELQWSMTIELNVTAVWRMSKLVLPHMRVHRKGTIVNNASDWGLVGGKKAVAYCASKGAVIQLTRAMALDHAHENIRINAICPGDTFVERWGTAGYFEGEGGMGSEKLAEAGALLPMGRVGQADEIAKAVLFLASDDSSFMTGSTLIVDGGNTAR